MGLDETIYAIAARREEIHADHATSRPLSDGYERVGLAGEFAFGEFCGIFPDLAERPGGDSGVDFMLPLIFTVDVKTARKAYYLLHEQEKGFADIYVLAEYDDETGRAVLVGWAWGAQLERAPIKDFGYGVMNHYIPRGELRPMSELSGRLCGIAKCTGE